MSDDEWMALSTAADILEQHGYHAESVAVFRVAEENSAG